MLAGSARTAQPRSASDAIVTALRGITGSSRGFISLLPNTFAPMNVVAAADSLVLHRDLGAGGVGRLRHFVKRPDGNGSREMRVYLQLHSQRWIAQEPESVPQRADAEHMAQFVENHGFQNPFPPPSGPCPATPCLSVSPSTAPPFFETPSLAWPSAPWRSGGRSKRTPGPRGRLPPSPGRTARPIGRSSPEPKP